MAKSTPGRPGVSRFNRGPGRSPPRSVVAVERQAGGALYGAEVTIRWNLRIGRIGGVLLGLGAIACQGRQGGATVADAATDDRIADVPAVDVRPFDVASGCAVESCCGNGRLDRGEECDDGNRESGDGCSLLCEIECPWRDDCAPVSLRGARCGDYLVGAGEVCDDGNTSPFDGCGPDCLTIEPGWICPVPGRRCVPICGDRIVTGPETCDDGNLVEGDGCSARCTVEVPCFDAEGSLTACPALCGDEKIEGDEACDDGPRNRDDAYDGCTTDCRFGPFCGDDITTPEHEACDLGARNELTYSVTPASGCTRWCARPHSCGDGYADPAFGEQCDFGAGNGKPGVISDGRICTCDASCQLTPDCF